MPPREPEHLYRLAIAATARRQLAERLPEAIAFAAFEFITGPLVANPHRAGKRLMSPLDDRHSARRGTYRIIYRIDDDEHVVRVLAVDGLVPDTSTWRLPAASAATSRRSRTGPDRRTS